MKFVLNDSKVRVACVEHILNIDVSKKPVQVVSIANFKKDRSNQQNRYYWKIVIGMFSEATGYTPAEIHETCKLQLLPTKIVQIGGVKKKLQQAQLHFLPLNLKITSKI